MTNVHLEHPDAKSLSAYGLGQLDEAAAARIYEHLEECTSCRSQVEAQADDTLAALVRAAATPPEGTVALQPTDNSAPAVPLTEAEVRTTIGTPSVIPSALADHARYRVLELLGHGGMGAVYRAEHRLMERTVALKVINRELTDRPAVVERFRREVKAAARLDHPNIVRAFEAEQAGDTLFLVMECVEGITLARLVAERGPLPVAEACDYVRQAALGLEHAFERGMVHRDIKPQNLMVVCQSPKHERGDKAPGAYAPDSDGVVKVLDFGLARLASEMGPNAAEASVLPTESGLSASVTAAGMVLGTADYIAPEQVDNPSAADTRADIYALGCTLYFLLTGQPPFPEGTVMQKLQAHANRTFRPLSEFRADVPAGLVRTLDRMTAKAPAQRYQTPGEVAAALAPFVGTTRAASPRPRRLWRMLTAAALLIALLAVAVVFKIQRDNQEIIITTNDPNIEVVMKRKGELVRIRDAKSGQTWELNTLTNEIGLVDQPDGLTLRLPDKEPFVLRRKGKDVFTVAWVTRPPEGDWIPLFNGKDLTGWKTHARLPKQADGWKVTKDGVLVGSGPFVSHLFTEGGDFEDFHLRAEVKINDQGNSGIYFRAGFDLPVAGKFPAGFEAQILNGLQFNPGAKAAEDYITGSLYGLQKTPKRLVLPDEWFTLEVIAEGTHIVIKVNGQTTVDYTDEKRTYTKGHIALQLLSHTAPVPQPTVVQFRKIEIKELGTRKALEKVGEVRRFEGHAGGIIGISFAPDGCHAVSTGYDKTIRLWDVQTSKEVCRFDGYTVWPYSAVLSPNGRTVLSGGDDRVLRVWDARTGKELRQGEGHTEGIMMVACSADSRQALTGSWDGTVRLWDVGSGKQLRVLEGHADAVTDVAFSPDGKRAISVSRDKTARLWELETGKELFKLEGHSDNVQRVAFSPDGHRALTGGFDKTVRLWDLDTGKEVLCLEGHASPIRSVAFSQDGRRLLSFAGPVDAETKGEQDFRIWDVATGKELGRVEAWGNLAAFSPDRRHLLMASRGHPDPRLWRLPEPHSPDTK